MPSIEHTCRTPGRLPIGDRECESRSLHGGSVGMFPKFPKDGDGANEYRMIAAGLLCVVAGTTPPCDFIILV